MSGETFYKATAAGGRALAGRGVWKPGVWRSCRPPLRPCSHGIHYCRRDQIVYWLNAELWTFEVADNAVTLDAGDKLVCSRGRTLERLEAWNDRTARLFAADCAERALRFIPGDHQAPFMVAIDAARSYARGEIGEEERAAAWAAARDAARDAPRDAPRDAAWDAPWAAARDAARAWQTERLFDYLEGRAGG